MKQKHVRQDGLWTKSLDEESVVQPNGCNGTVVVDVTYLCDATCKYCRWGDSTTPQRAVQTVEKACIPKEILRDLKTKRVVISGGEPTLHPDINKILRWYSKLVEQVVIITNGYKLTKSKMAELLDAGVTGFTVSVDSIDPVESYHTRGTQLNTHKQILDIIRYAAGLESRRFELGINCTVSHVTANWDTVRQLLDFGIRHKLDFIKFQPIFDDGYVLKNAPGLLLSKKDVGPLLYIADMVSQMEDGCGITTNPAEFWLDVATHVAGGDDAQKLDAGSCALNTTHAISVQGRLSMCFWVDSSCYGGSSDKIPSRKLKMVQDSFDAEKQKCNVDFHCFCNQGIDHVWKKV